MSEETKLLPCPFCGSEAEINAVDRLIEIKCSKCDLRMSYKGILQTKPDYSNELGGIKPVNKNSVVKEYYHVNAKNQAIKKWNTRNSTTNDLNVDKLLRKIMSYEDVVEHRKDNFEGEIPVEIVDVMLLEIKNLLTERK